MVVIVRVDGRWQISLSKEKEKRMKRLFLVRHGEYRGDHLSEHGEDQIIRLSYVMKEFMNLVENSIILSSPVRRAIESAQIMAKKIDNITIMDTKNVILDEKSAYDKKFMPKIRKLIKTSLEKADIVVFITHLNVIECIYRYFLYEKKFNDVNLSKIVMLEYGDACLIDFDEKSVTYIRKL